MGDKKLFDERCKQDPQIGPRVLAGAKGLAKHMMMCGGSPPWEDMQDDDRLNMITQALAVLRGADAHG